MCISLPPSTWMRSLLFAIVSHVVICSLFFVRRSVFMRFLFLCVLGSRSYLVLCRSFVFSVVSFLFDQLMLPFSEHVFLALVSELGFSTLVFCRSEDADFCVC